MPRIPTGDASDHGWTAFGVGNGHGDDSKLEEWSSLIGIITAISGNVVIALALNVQRYSHIKLHKERNEARERAKEAERRARNGGSTGYGATDATPRASHGDEQDDEDETPETHPLSHSFQSGNSSWTESSGDDGNEVSTTYLKSPSWWAGQVLMTIGEMGNFLAYGFAPASIVSPLGVVALISNCVIAPLFFGEIFRKRDFWGVVIAVAGAVTVVLSAKQEETKLEPHDVWDAITALAFEIYMAVSITLIIILMWASPRYGHRTILIDLGLVGLFGAYTALTTKGVSSMLSATLLRAFTTPVTYALLVVLLGTAVMQVRYVNKALQRFDSTQVIPIQFVMFTLSVIIGSAVLYRDFERTSAEQAVKFIGGCLLTFFGVFLITSGRPQHDDEDQLSDDEGVEETIGLMDQEAADQQQEGAKVYSDPHQPKSPKSPKSSRRSSRTSRVSFVDPTIRSMTVQQDSGVPSIRKPEPSTSRGSPIGESSPLLVNPWNNSVQDRPTHPGLPPTFSEDSVATIYSVTTQNSEDAPQIVSTASLPAPLVAPSTSADQRPVTPRHSFSSSRPHSHHFSNNFISPSPLSSTVSAVMADALLRGEDSPVPRRSKSMRRMRPSIRSSLFVPQDEEEDGSPEGEALLRTRSGEPDREPPSTIEEESGLTSSTRKSLKGRTRSLSNTLGDFFGRKKRSRRSTNPEAGLGQDSQESGLTDTSESGNGNGSRSGDGAGSDGRES